MLPEHKPRVSKEERRLSKKELKEACKDPFIQTKIKLRGGWKAPLMYRVLMTFQLSSKDRKEVSKILVRAITPQKARELIGSPSGTKPGWSYREISLVKDFECGVLQFKGLAVCLFYKRQCAEIEPIATDPIPIGSLETEDDIWARLDLFSKSPRELHASVREDLVQLTMENEELKHSIAIRDVMISDLERKLKLKK